MLTGCLVFLLCVYNFWYSQLECGLLEWNVTLDMHANNMTMTL